MCIDNSFVLDIEKIENSRFLFREWFLQFKIFFFNTTAIQDNSHKQAKSPDKVQAKSCAQCQPQNRIHPQIQAKPRTSTRIQSQIQYQTQLRCQTNELIFDIYVEGINELATFSSQDTANCIDFLLEILEYSELHQFALTCGIHFKLCYLVMELDYNQDEKYALIDTILYMIYLLSMSKEGKKSLGNYTEFINFLNNKIYKDLQYYQIYTLDLCQAILQKII